MAVEVSNCRSPDDLQAALAPIFHYFGGNLNPEDVERWRQTMAADRMHIAREDGEVIGGAGAFSFELTVPGGFVPSAGVTVVGVYPTHRRRGVLRAMMRHQLDEVHRRGEPVAWLWASEESIYPRFGYGLASFMTEINIPRSTSAFLQPFERRGTVRIVSEEDSLAPVSAVYDRVRRETPGMFARGEAWWKHRRLNDPEIRRAGGGRLNRAILAIDGEPRGYALYRIHQSMEQGVTKGFLSVFEAMGDSLEATREVWRFLLDVDWTASVKAMLLPVDHPLFLLLARPRTMGARLLDALWVRLVDVPRALAARTIAPGEPVVIEVADEFCPWNAGRYRISSEGAERTDAAPDLACQVNALGSVYLGGLSFLRLQRAGRIEEKRPGAVARADALFPSDRAPWCPEIF